MRMFQISQGTYLYFKKQILAYLTLHLLGHPALEGF